MLCVHEAAPRAWRGCRSRVAVFHGGWRDGWLSVYRGPCCAYACSATMSVVHPHRLELSHARYVAEGLSTTATYDNVGSFLAATEVVIGGLSMDTIHADHLVVAADMYHTEPPVVVAPPRLKLSRAEIPRTAHRATTSQPLHHNGPHHVDCRSSRGWRHQRQRC